MGLVFCACTIAVWLWSWVSRAQLFKFSSNITITWTSKLRFSTEEYQEYLRLKSSIQAQLCLVPSISTTCISQLLDSQGPWVIDSGASDHIFGNASLFSSMSFPKFPHLITLANVAKVASKGVGQISVSPINLEFILCS